MNIGVLYTPTTKPWGGVNSFFRSLIWHAERDRQVQYTKDLKRADIILTDGQYRGPGRVLRRWQLASVSRQMSPWNPLGQIFGKKRIPVVFRLDGLRQIYAANYTGCDTTLVNNLVFASNAVFQSSFSRWCFDHASITYPTSHRIITNGADPRFFYPRKNCLTIKKGEKLLLITNSWSTNEYKGFRTIALISKLESVKVMHIGRWPKEEPSGNVRLLGMKSHSEIGDIYRAGHYLLFPSRYEACSNVMVEALACGLPALYHSSGGTPELFQEDELGIELPKKIMLSVAYDFMRAALDKYARLSNLTNSKSEYFQFPRCYNQYIKYLREIVS